MSNNEYYKEWKKKHPDYHKEWKKKHPECVKKYSKRSSIAKSEIQNKTLSHACNKYNRWTIDDIEKLKAYIYNGMTYSEIADKLHRTLYSITTKVSLLKRKGEM